MKNKHICPVANHATRDPLFKLIAAKTELSAGSADKTVHGTGGSKCIEK